jgi:uncharacterized membrane protein
MRPWPAWLLLLLSLAGIVLAADAVLRGGATLSLIVIVPVVSGSSPELFAGVGLIFLGFLGWVLVSASRSADVVRTPDVSTRDPSTAGDGESSMGGVVLIGPIPIFLGGYRPGSRRAQWAWVAAGVALTVGVWVVLAALAYFR